MEKMRTTIVKKVNLRREVERRIGKRELEIKSNVLYRIVVFNMNRTTMIDMKDDSIDNSRFANRIKSDQLTAFAYFMCTHNRRMDPKSQKPRKEQY